MAKSAFPDYQYTLLLLDAEERCLAGLVSVRDLAGTQRLAMSALRLNDRAAFVDVHHYAPHAAELEQRKPVLRVSLDDDKAEA